MKVLRGKEVREAGAGVWEEGEQSNKMWCFPDSYYTMLLYCPIPNGNVGIDNRSYALDKRV